MTVQRVLTGITTSGTPHLGNYAGAIRPAIAASQRAGVESFYFLADYHALIKTTDPLRVQRSTLEIAATWLAAGLDTERVWFYRQSDIPEIPELTWLVTCVAGKGLLNRAHAYKAEGQQRCPPGGCYAGGHAGRKVGRHHSVFSKGMWSFCIHWAGTSTARNSSNCISVTDLGSTPSMITYSVGRLAPSSVRNLR